MQSDKGIGVAPTRKEVTENPFTKSFALLLHIFNASLTSKTFLNKIECSIICLKLYSSLLKLLLNCSKSIL